MNVYFFVYDEIISVLRSSNIITDDINVEAITVDVPTEKGHGEIMTNAAMVLVKHLKKPPRDIAVKIKELLESKSNVFSSVKVAGPGFINLTLNSKYWYQELETMVSLDNNYGKLDLGKKRKVNLEFASPNPTGPMHIGHARGAIYGDVLASLLSYVGYDVTKEYYINDAGNQINILVESVFFRYKELYDNNTGELPQGCYPGEYVIDVAKLLQDKYSDTLLSISNTERQQKIRKFVIDAMMRLIKKDLELIGVKHDVFFSETTLHEKNAIDDVVQFLEEKGMVYQGILEKPKGYSDNNWDSREQLLFNSTKYDDDIDRALKKSDGSWTYFAADMAYLRNKLDRGFHDLIMVLGADHIGFIKRMKALCASLNNNDDSILDIKICQLVNFLKEGKPLKMSKRAGTFIGVKEIVDLVSKDVIRFMMLIKKNTHPIDFDVGKVIEQSKDNPVFYVQYASARTASVLRYIEELDRSFISNISENLQNIDLSLLKSEKELSLIRLLSYWPKVVERAVLSHDPHRIVSYLHDVAVQFHALWTYAKEDPYFKFIQEDNMDLTRARGLLAYSTSTIISSGLSIIGVKAAKKM